MQLPNRLAKMMLRIAENSPAKPTEKSGLVSVSWRAWWAGPVKA